MGADVAWPTLPRSPRRFRSVPGENPPTLGRKFCSKCGRWRLLLDFPSTGYQPDGTAKYLESWCRTCATVVKRLRNGHKPKEFKGGRMTGEALNARQRELYRKRRNDPNWLARRREYLRIYGHAKRREQGLPERQYPDTSPRAEPYSGQASESVPSGPFIEWVDRWRAKQDEMRGGENVSYERPVASLEDLAELAGCSAKAFWRARHEGTVSLSIVDRVLVAAGGDTMLWQLYPDA